MPATSLVKFMDRRDGNGRGPLHWGRADIDGAPFRGESMPAMSEDEMQDRLVRVCDARNRTFDLSKPEDNAAYLDVLDMITNQWAQLVHREHLKVRTRRRDPDTGEVVRDVRIKVYVEWVEPYMQDGKPMPSQRPYLGRSNAGV